MLMPVRFFDNHHFALSCEFLDIAKYFMLTVLLYCHFSFLSIYWSKILDTSTLLKLFKMANVCLIKNIVLQFLTRRLPPRRQVGVDFVCWLNIHDCFILFEFIQCVCWKHVMFHHPVRHIWWCQNVDLAFTKITVSKKMLHFPFNYLIFTLQFCWFSLLESYVS